MGDLVGGAGALHGNAAAPGVHQLLRNVGGHLCLDESGTNHVDPDISCGEFFGAALGESYDAGFGGGIVGLFVVAGDSYYGTHIDYGAESLFPHHGLDGLGHGEDAAEVHLYHTGELFLGHALDGRVIGDAGVVDQDVYMAEIVEDVFDKLGGLLHVGDVGDVASCLAAELVEGVFCVGDKVGVAGAEGDVAAFAGEA